MPAAKLLNPGPVTLTERVRMAMTRPDICHREREFAELTVSVIARLGEVYGPESAGYRAVLLTGSGTAAVEAMLGTLVPRDGRVLVVANGVYGDRGADILLAQGKPFVRVASPWTAPIDMSAVAELLSGGGFTHVFAVHHETTTGRLNDIAILGRACLRHGTPLLLDAVSSFAGERIRFTDWHLEACAATANKCIHGVPGVSFVLVRDLAFDERPSAAPSVYLDLHRYRESQANGFSPFTQAVHVLHAFDEALQELHDMGGWAARHAHYVALSSHVRSGLGGLGIQTLLAPRCYGASLCSYRVPDGLSYAELHAALKRDGYVIYAGQGSLAGSIFRIAVMGDLDRADMARVVASVGRAVLSPAPPVAVAGSEA